MSVAFPKSPLAAIWHPSRFPRTLDAAASVDLSRAPAAKPQINLPIPHKTRLVTKTLLRPKCGHESQRLVGVHFEPACLDFSLFVPGGPDIRPRTKPTAAANRSRGAVVREAVFAAIAVTTTSGVSRNPITGASAVVASDKTMTARAGT